MARRVFTLLIPITSLFWFHGANHVQAQLECSQTVVEKGEVRSGVPLSHRFSFSNKGSEAIEIIEVRPSCGCLAPQLAQRRLKPGQMTELSLEMNTLTQPAGVNNWRITLRYKVGEAEKELSLYLAARIVAEISLEPPSLAVYTDSSIRHEITVIDRRAEPLLVRAVTPTSPHVRTHLGELSRDKDGKWRRTIGVEVLADCPEGTHAEMLRIFTSDPLYSELKVPFTVFKRTRTQVKAEPASVVLSVPTGQPLPSRIVLLGTEDDREVQIENVETDNKAIECRWAQGPGHRATLKIHVNNARVPANRFRGFVRVHVNKPEKETITIPVSCLLN
jgi:hypothetical protein